MKPIRLIVGLGNPGLEYRDTRHNAGFWWVDKLASELSVRLSNESKFHGFTARGKHAGQDIWLLQPTTFMNRSGRSVLALANFFRILPDEILVIHDELDLAPGVAKLKKGGGNGGHNGLKDISACLTTPEYWRLRLGIGHPGHRDMVADYVLHPPRREEQGALDEAIDRSLATWPLMIAGNFEAAMLKLHTKSP
ncbi:MAG TPA: aminoacyl-tRNA hydrolase [Burkholderiales bacterium]|nr:aminoacyl-tRNA hydrolase [Burkholderiales bacterium]